MMNLRIRQQPTIILLLAVLLISTGCQSDKRHYVIGVSQCSEDIWREKQNAELKMGAYFHDNVELKFAAAYDSDERQIQQIDSLVNEGVDLLIVAPNQVQTISPAIDRAYDKASLSSCSSARPAPRSTPPLSVPTTMRWAKSWAATSQHGLTEREMCWK